MEVEMVSLPTRFGGMSFVDPVADSPEKFADSVKCTASLTALLVNRESELPHGVLPDRAAATAVRKSRESRLKEKADAIQFCLPEPQRQAMELAHEKGGSSTLSTLPFAEHGFFFAVKSDFHDHVGLRYYWPLDNLPSSCPCGSTFNVDHAQT